MLFLTNRKNIFDSLPKRATLNTSESQIMSQIKDLLNKITLENLTWFLSLLALLLVIVSWNTYKRFDLCINNCQSIHLKIQNTYFQFCYLLPVLNRKYARTDDVISIINIWNEKNVFVLFKYSSLQKEVDRRNSFKDFANHTIENTRKMLDNMVLMEEESKKRMVYTSN